MQEEVENRTVNLAVTTTKLTARNVLAACMKYLRHRGQVKEKKAAEKAAKAKENESGRTRVYLTWISPKQTFAVLKKLPRNMVWIMQFGRTLPSSRLAISCFSRQGMLMR